MADEQEEQAAESGASGASASEGDQATPPKGDDAQQAAGTGTAQELDDDPEPQLDDMVRRGMRFINNGNLVMGSVAGSSSPRTSSISGAVLEATLAHFTPPPAFVEAAAVLHRHRLVVLNGDERTGRRCGALALLTRSAPLDVDCRRPIVELSPGTTTAALRDFSFDAGGRYLVTDCTPGEETDEQVRFDLDELCKRVGELGAVVVATSSVPAGRFSEREVPWHPVNGRTVLEKYLSSGDRGHDDEARALLLGIAEGRLPGELPRFFELLERSEATDVERHFKEGDANILCDRISARPHVSDLLPLVAAAFLPGAVERNYEFHLDRLHELVDRHARRSPWTRKYKNVLRQSRRERAVWVTSHSHPFDPRERAVALANPVEPGFLLTQLKQHYGRELWSPVHTWLLERPSEIDSLADEWALARGMAHFIRVDPVDAHAVLNTWAREQPMPPRYAAAAVVSALCSDEATVDDARGLAITWSRGTRRTKIVATLAFGQALGWRYPVEAVSHLWLLSLGDAAVAGTARNQFIAFVRAGARDDNHVRRTLSVVDWQLERLLQGQAYQDKSIHQALETVSTILSAEVVDGTSLTLHILRRLPDQIGRLGRLWAEVLRSWPHRSAALGRLLATHDSLEPVDQGSTFADLGKAVRHHLTPAEWGWVCRDLGVSLWTGTTRDDHGGEGEGAAA